MKNGPYRRRGILIGALLVLGWACACVALATQGQRLTGSVVAAIARAQPVPLSAREAHQSLTLTIVLRRDEPRQFARFLRAVYDPRSAQYHRFLSGRALADRFGPSRSDYERVLGYLRKRRFHLIAGSADRLTLTVRASRARIERVLRVDIADYRLGTRHFYANNRAPWLPASIAPRVQAIVGLSDLAQPRHVGAGDATQWIWNQIPSQASTLLTCLSPAAAAAIQNGQVETAPSLADAIEAATAPVACELNMIAAYAQSYGAFPDPVPGTGQTIGLLEFSNYYPSDVQNYLDLLGMGSDFPNLSEVNVNGGAGTPGPGESEVLLDIDAVMSLAPGAKVEVFDGPFQGSGTFQSMLNAMISAGVNVISNSWAYCENETDLADVQSINSILETAAADGITVVSGAGDHGSTCLDGAANTIPVPADAPYITAVGGTEALPSLLGTYGSETWWNGLTDTPPNGQGGFGVSRFFTAPPYQTALSGSSMRSVPDVSAPADPLQGFLICQADNGGCPSNWLYGGTSVAAPIWAAIVAVLNQELGHNLGFLNPLLYPLANTSAFHSAASMGTDFAHVGLGSPNVNELRRLLAGATTGGVDLAHSGIEVLPIPVMADGVSVAPVSVTLLDSNFYTVSGQSVTLSADSGSHAVITTVRGSTDLNGGVALFEVSDSVPETVTLTATTAAGPLPNTATVTFVTPPAASGGITASPTVVTADGSSSTTITVTLEDASGHPSPGKVVGLSQGNGASQISATTATTNSSGTVNFTATDDTAETVTYTATDITDGNLPVPGSAQVQFMNAAGPPPCNIGLGTAAAGYAVSTFASGFAYGSNCVGPIGLAFGAQDNLLVADGPNGNLYQFGPQGGSADPGHLIGNPFGGAVQSGLVFDSHGSLYATGRAGALCTVVNAIVQLNPDTGQIIRQLTAPGSCPLGLAIDPLSDNLFVSDTYGGIYELAGYSSGPGTASSYALGGQLDTDGITFSPDGTLYAANEASGAIYSVTGTNSATPGVATEIASVPGADGITLVTDPSNASLPYVVVNSNDGDIVKIDQTTSPATLTTIYSGGSRGDFVTVGPDGCMYATQTDRIIRITNANGSCDFQPATVNPQLRLVPNFSGSLPQGSAASFTATVQNVTSPGGTPVVLAVNGVNPGVHEAPATASGGVTLTYDGVYAGTDSVVARATVNGAALVSNAVNVTWSAGAHTTYLDLNNNAALVSANQPTTMTADLFDVSANPQAPVAGQSVQFTLEGQSCTASTDTTGTASCTITPTTFGAAALSAAFAGNSQYVAASASRRVDVLAPAPTVSISVAPTSIVPGDSATLTWSSSGATACTASGAWSGAVAASGRQTVSPTAAGTYTYLLSCAASGGAAQASATLTVSSAGTSSAPTVSISVSPAAITLGNSATLTWSTTNATACSAGGAWTGSQSTFGTQTVTPASAGTYTYSLTCTGTGGSARGSTTLSAKAVSVTISGNSGGGGALSLGDLALLLGLFLARRSRARSRPA